MTTLKFLVPTDFSENAGNAAHYAAALARKANASLHFLHIIPPVATDNAFLTIERAGVIEESTHQVKKWYSTYTRQGDLVCDGEALIGDITDTITATAEKQRCDFIIMGTRGASGLKKILLGSHAASVIDRSSIPVLVVPEGSPYQPLKKIVYATDYQNSDIDALKKMVSLARLFDATVEVVHVSAEDASGGTELSIIDYFSDLVRKEITYPSLAFRVLQDEDKVNGLEQYARTSKADLLALSTRKRSVVKRLFDKSLTKALAYHARLPLLSLHIQEVNHESNTII